MNIKCNSKALMKALTLANNAIPTGSIVMPVLDHFLLEGNDDGKLIVRATDLNHMIKVQTDIDVDAGMSVLLPSMITMNTIKDLPEQEIEIQFDDDNNIRIVSSYGEYSMKTHGTEDFPSDFFNDLENPILVAGDDFVYGLNSSMFAAANDEMKPQVSSISVKVTTDAIEIVTTNTSQLYRYKILTNNSSECSIMLPRKTVSLLKKLVTDGDTLTMYVKSGKACFLYKNISFMCNLIGGSYLPYEKVFPTNNDKKIEVNLSEFQKSMKRLISFGSNEHPMVLATYSNNEIKLVCANFEMATQASETIKCVYEGEEITCKYNARMLLETLMSFNSGVVHVLLESVNRPSMLVPDHNSDGIEITNLLMPYVDRRPVEVPA